jgi:type IV pilus assembly protein PilY1
MGMVIGNAHYFTIDEASLANKVKWEYPNSSTPLEQVKDLGYSFSRAFIVPTKADPGWVVIFGNGYNSPNESAVVFVLDAFTGEKLNMIDTYTGPCNGLSSPTAIDDDNDGYLDHIYAGDLKGNVWKFDCTGTVVEWEVAYETSAGMPAPLFQAKDEAGNTQPITNMVDAMYHCIYHGNMVVFGTGKYLGNADFADGQTQTIYGVWDYGDDDDDSEYLGSFERTAESQLSNQPSTVTLLEQTEMYF